MRWTSLSVMVLMQPELLGSVFIAALPEFHLYPLSGSANTTFTIGGTDYLNSSRIRFRVGKQIFLPKRFEKVGYESTVAFSVSAFGSSFSSVEVTRNGRDFFFTGTLFQCVYPTISDVHPVDVMKHGGTIVTIRGSGLSGGYYCRSKDLSVISVEGSTVSSALMKCEIPVTERGDRSTSQVYLSAKPDIGLLSNGGHTLRLLEEAKYSQISDVEVQLAGHTFTDYSSAVWCKLGSLYFFGRIISSSRLSCADHLVHYEGSRLQISLNQVDFVMVQDMRAARESEKVGNRSNEKGQGHHISTPRKRIAPTDLSNAEQAIDNGYTALSVASTMLQFHHHSYSSLPLAFTFYGAPNIDSLNPSVGTFGGAHMTWLSGQNFVTDGVYELHCLFGNLSQSIRFISSAIVTCDVPLLLEYGSVDVAISTTLRRPLNVRPEVALTYTLLGRTHVDSFEPKKGTSRGGTMLHLHGSGFLNSRDSSCKFGNIQVQAEYASESEIRCNTPSRAHGDSNIQVILGGRHVCGAAAYVFVS